MRDLRKVSWTNRFKGVDWSIKQLELVEKGQMASTKYVAASTRASTKKDLVSERVCGEDDNDDDDATKDEVIFVGKKVSGDEFREEREEEAEQEEEKQEGEEVTEPTSEENFIIFKHKIK